MKFAIGKVYRGIDIKYDEFVRVKVVNRHDNKIDIVVLYNSGKTMKKTYKVYTRTFPDIDGSMITSELVGCTDNCNVSVLACNAIK